MTETNVIPYATRDFAEAVTLASCGIPFCYPNHRMIHYYKSSFLREKGMTATQCIERGIEGDMVWVFAHTEDCKKVVEAFHKVWRKKDDSLILDRWDIGELATVIATGLRNRRELSNDWKAVDPHIAIEKPDGSVTIVSKNAPDIVLETWGLKL